MLGLGCAAPMLCVSIDTCCRSTKKKFPNLQVREGVPVVIRRAISPEFSVKLPRNATAGARTATNMLAVMPHEAEY